MSNEIIYLNHAGTSWPKPKPVRDAVVSATHSDPTQWNNLFRDSFETLSNFFHVDSSRLVLTPSCTAALTLAILDQNWLPTDQVITSSFEHHAVYRNLVQLRRQGITVTEIPAATNSLFDLELFENELKRGKTKLVAITAACNVTGALLPWDEIIHLSHRYDAKVLLDGAQIAGWWSLDLVDLGVDYFVFAGHKGQQAPWGIGGLYVAESSVLHCPTAACEFTAGKQQEFDSKPGYCDAGSVNLVALAGLAAGCTWLASTERSHRLSQSRQLAAKFTDAIRQVSGSTVHHDLNIQDKMPTVAISFGNQNQKIAAQLKASQIIVSSGFQCAPLAHQTLGTAQHGVLRFSFGPTQANVDFDAVIQAIEKALSGSCPAA